MTSFKEKPKNNKLLNAPGVSLPHKWKMTQILTSIALAAL